MIRLQGNSSDLTKFDLRPAAALNWNLSNTLRKTLIYALCSLKSDTNYVQYEIKYVMWIKKNNNKSTNINFKAHEKELSNFRHCKLITTEHFIPHKHIIADYLRFFVVVIAVFIAVVVGMVVVVVCWLLQLPQVQLLLLPHFAASIKIDFSQFIPFIRKSNEQSDACNLQQTAPAHESSNNNKSATIFATTLVIKCNFPFRCCDWKAQKRKSALKIPKKICLLFTPVVVTTVCCCCRCWYCS